MRTKSAPILVTGAPRSGTTWMARLLATAPGTALAGREPMNPTGRQYALAGTLDGWSRISAPTQRQERALRLAYSGRTPWTYGRYGRRQWAAPLPATRVVVKDPFALLSLPAVVRTTGARPIVVYRHPAAVLVSYRRLGWPLDLAEVRRIVEQNHAVHSGAAEVPPPPEDDEASEAEAMGWFWSALHSIALADIAESNALVVSHEELAAGGISAAARLFSALELRPGRRTDEEFSAGGADVHSSRLHNLDRNPADVAREWQGRLGAEDFESIESVASKVYARLEAERLALDPR